MSRRERLPRGVRPHHIMFTDATHSSQESSNKVKGNQWLKPPLYDEPHAALHEAIPTVPVLDHITAQYVEREFEPIPGNYFRTVDSLLFAMQAAKNHYRHNTIQYHLTGLAMMAIDMQRPYVQEGLWVPER